MRAAAARSGFGMCRVMRGTDRAFSHGGMLGRSRVNARSECWRCHERNQQKNENCGTAHEGFAKNREHHQCKTSLS